MMLSEIINKMPDEYRKKLKSISAQVEKLAGELIKYDSMPVGNESIYGGLTISHKASKLIGRITNFQTIMWNNDNGLNPKEKHILDDILNQYKAAFRDCMIE